MPPELKIRNLHIEGATQNNLEISFNAVVQDPESARYSGANTTFKVTEATTNTSWEQLTTHNGRLRFAERIAINPAHPISVITLNVHAESLGEIFVRTVSYEVHDAVAACLLDTPSTTPAPNIQRTTLNNTQFDALVLPFIQNAPTPTALVAFLAKLRAGDFPEIGIPTETQITNATTAAIQSNPLTALELQFDDKGKLKQDTQPNLNIPGLTKAEEEGLQAFFDAVSSKSKGKYSNKEVRELGLLMLAKNTPQFLITRISAIATDLDFNSILSETVKSLAEKLNSINAFEMEGLALAERNQELARIKAEVDADLAKIKETAIQIILGLLAIAAVGVAIIVAIHVIIEVIKFIITAIATILLIVGVLIAVAVSGSKK